MFSSKRGAYDVLDVALMCLCLVFVLLLFDKIHSNNSKVKAVWDHPFIMYAKSSEKLTFLSHWYTDEEMLVFQNILGTFQMDDP